MLASILGVTIEYQFLPLALAIILDVIIVVYCARDLYRPDRRVIGDKAVWLLIIVFGSLVGCVAYLVYGRRE